jgi:hypothetical protein
MLQLLTDWKEAAPAAAAATAIVSAVVALLVLMYTRYANRRRATLDIVMKTLLDESAQKIQDNFKAIIRKDKDANNPFTLQSLLALSAKGTPDRVAMLKYLNVYELIALGIRRKIFDEAFYKRWFHNQFLDDYESSSVFIKGLQTTKTSIYCESTMLYNK